MIIDEPFRKLKAKFRNIQARIFLTFALFILALMMSFVTIFYLSTAKAVESKAFESISQTSDLISKQIDAQLQGLNSISMQILSSSTLINLFYTSQFASAKVNILDRRMMNELAYLLAGPDYSSLQINMINSNGDFYGVGYSNIFRRIDPAAIRAVPWTNAVFAAEGRRVLLSSHLDDWRITNRVGVSICRAFSSAWGLPVDSMVELQLDYRKIESAVSDSINPSRTGKPGSKAAWVFDEAGILVYPILAGSTSINAKARALWAGLGAQPKDSPFWRQRDAETKSMEIAARSRSKFSGWTTIATESESAFLTPIITLRNNTFLVGLVALFITLLLSWFVSSGLTGPIKRIHHSIKSLNLETIHLSAFSSVDSGVNELEELNNAFEEMRLQLKDSLREMVAARSLEIQSRLLAMQAQMNPHFLHNTILNISIMAEESGATAVVKACSDLSQMLRYISRDENAPILLEQELQHTENFLKLMKIRYAERIAYRIGVAPDMHAIKIPKLIIQPLVENSTKYGINTDPPWAIAIEGAMGDGRWTVSVEDNGTGFSRESLARIGDRMRAFDLAAHVPALELDGMGLLNIYIRLKLLYGPLAVFHLENGSGGGAKVTIGGPVVPVMEPS